MVPLRWVVGVVRVPLNTPRRSASIVGPDTDLLPSAEPSARLLFPPLLCCSVLRPSTPPPFVMLNAAPPSRACGVRVARVWCRRRRAASALLTERAASTHHAAWVLAARAQRYEYRSAMHQAVVPRGP